MTLITTNDKCLSAASVGVNSGFVLQPCSADVQLFNKHLRHWCSDFYGPCRQTLGRPSTLFCVHLRVESETFCDMQNLI